jgi:hypothetical protein
MNEPATSASAMDELQKDPALAPIIANTRGKKLYDALKARLTGENNPTRRRQLEDVLGNRRWFLEPLTRAPSLSTVNGVGTMLYGESEKDGDGTYVATLFIVFFFIPIFPLAQYLVRDLGGRKWSFFGKVPNSMNIVRWRLAVGLGTLVAVAAIALGAIESSRHSNVQFVNALDVPVKIHAGKMDLSLKANDRTSRRMSSGNYDVKVTTADGRAIEEEKLKVPGATDLVAYNVLGAAPLYRQPITYYAAGHEGTDKDEPILDSGKKVIIEDHIDYVFTEPLKEISMPSGSDMQRRWRFDLAPGGWKLSAAYLVSQKKNDEAVRLVEAVAQASPDDETTLNVVSTVIERAKGSDELFAFAARIAEKFPDAIEPQRLHQSLQMMKGGRAELLAKYRERAEKNPTSATAGYLVARLELPAAALPRYQELQKKFPDDLHVQRGLAWVLLQLRKFPEANAEFERLAKIAHAPVNQELEGQAAALIALGKAKQAAELIAAHAEEDPANKTLYARVAHLAGEEHPDRFLQPSGTQRSWYEAMFGDFAKQPPLEEPEQGALAVLAAMRKSGKAALQALDKAGPEAPSYLDRGYVLVLAAEALREKDRARAEKILDQLSPPSTEVERAAILDGKDSPEITDLQLDRQSVIELARGWRLGDRKLVEQAKADDLFKGAVATALGWRCPCTESPAGGSHGRGVRTRKGRDHFQGLVARPLGGHVHGRRRTDRHAALRHRHRRFGAQPVGERAAGRFLVAGHLGNRVDVERVLLRRLGVVVDDRAGPQGRRCAHGNGVVGVRNDARDHPRVGGALRRDRHRADALDAARSAVAIRHGGAAFGLHHRRRLGDVRHNHLVTAV